MNAWQARSLNNFSLPKIRFKFRFGLQLSSKNASLTLHTVNDKYFFISLVFGFASKDFQIFVLIFCFRTEMSLRSSVGMTAEKEEFPLFTHSDWNVCWKPAYAQFFHPVFNLHFVTSSESLAMLWQRSKTTCLRPLQDSCIFPCGENC